METGALSNFALAELGRYARTRLVCRRVVALWLLLIGALLAAAPVPPLGSVLAEAGFLGLAIALLRLWDDLADLPHDRAKHPHRVLATSSNLTCFRALAGIGLPLLGLALLPDLRRVVVYGALLGILAWLYHGRMAAGLSRPARTYLVLVKYPVLVFVGGAGPSARALLVGLVFYGLLCIHEWHDDQELQAASSGQAGLAVGVGSVIIALLFLT